MPILILGLALQFKISISKYINRVFLKRTLLEMLVHSGLEVTFFATVKTFDANIDNTVHFVLVTKNRMNSKYAKV